MEEKGTIHIHLLTELTGNLYSEESEWEEDWSESGKRVYIVGYLDFRCAEKYYLNQKQMEQLLFKSGQEVREKESTVQKD